MNNSHVAVEEDLGAAAEGDVPVRRLHRVDLPRLHEIAGEAGGSHVELPTLAT